MVGAFVVFLVYKMKHLIKKSTNEIQRTTQSSVIIRAGLVSVRLFFGLGVCARMIERSKMNGSGPFLVRQAWVQIPLRAFFYLFL